MPFKRPARTVNTHTRRMATTARAALVLAFALAAVLVATRLEGLIDDLLLGLYSVLTISVTVLVITWRSQGTATRHETPARRAGNP
jgi:hypothetical protein